MLRRQKEQLQEELELVRSQRQLHRERRKYAGSPVVALVGYTNAGKSTLLNRLAGSQALAEDKLFATLDPTTRASVLTGGQEILFSDTWDLSSASPQRLWQHSERHWKRLPKLILLVHVVDASHPNVQHQIEAVEHVLEDIGAGGLPMVLRAEQSGSCSGSGSGLISPPRSRSHAANREGLCHARNWYRRATTQHQ